MFRQYNDFDGDDCANLDIANHEPEVNFMGRVLRMKKTKTKIRDVAGTTSYVLFRTKLF